MTPPVDDISRIGGTRTICCCVCGTELFVEIISTSCTVAVVESPLSPTVSRVADVSNGVSMIDCGGDGSDVDVSLCAATLKSFLSFYYSTIDEEMMIAFGDGRGVGAASD